MLLVVQVLGKLVEPGVEEGNQDGQALGHGLIGRLVEIVFPEVDDEKVLLLAIGQPFEVLAGRLVAGAAADHLFELDA